MRVPAGRLLIIILTTSLWLEPVNAQQRLGTVSPSNAETITPDGYVRLEVQVGLTGSRGPTQFNSCPREKLWDLNVTDLLEGAKQVSLGITLSGPLVPQLVMTPVSIQRTRSGPFGMGRRCEVSVDLIRYASPAVSVRRHTGASFTVSPTYTQTNTVNPGVITTVNAAAGLAARLGGVPAETAQPFQATLQSMLSAVSVGHRETVTRHLLIQSGPAPGGDEFSWVAHDAFPSRGGNAAADLVIRARLVPIASLVEVPQASGDGRRLWTPTLVLSSSFGAGLTPGLNPAGTLLGYIEGVAGTELNNYRTAANSSAAAVACDSLKGKIDAIGLSTGDAALVMWALTHDRPPRGVTPLDIDNMNCLRDAWERVPAEVLASKTPQALPQPAQVPPTTRQMQAVTQIDDAFARFFVTPTWQDRRRYAETLFAYPATYSDPRGLVLPGSTTLSNPDQWLALHTAETPYLEKVGCYTYVPATRGAADARSVMYAIGDLVGAGREVLLTAVFANGAGEADAKIVSLSVSEVISDEQRAVIRANRANQCASGYAPAVIFSR
jgi:hypothetical protein